MFTHAPWPHPPARQRPEALDGLAALGLVRTRLTWVATTPLRFRQRPGDTLWAALGALACRRDPDLYRRLFKPAAEAGGAPSPFVLATTPAAATSLTPGAALAAELTLVGWAGRHLPFFLELALALEEAGLGSGREEGYGRLCLARVEALGADGEPCPLPTAHPPAPMSEADLAAASGRLPERALTLRLMTPTYLKAGGRLAEPSAPLLLRRLAWRVRELVRLHGAGEAPDFRPLLEAVSVRGRFAGEGLATGHRFSRRQTRERGRAVEVPVEGHLGSLTLEGDLGALRPLLLVGQWLHVGKNTERGYGRYTLADAPSAPTL